MLDLIKTALRVNGTAFDEELAALISAAKTDLEGGGLVFDENNPLHVQAVICFCKARYGFEDTVVAEKYFLSYQAHKAQLCTGI